MKPALFLSCLLLVSVVSASSITTLQLDNRPAAELIPIIEPMLAPGDVITGQGFTIILRASPQTVEDVKTMLEALDQAATMLQISVFQGSKRSLEAMSASGSLSVEGDNTNISVGNDDTNDAGNIDYRSDSVSVGAAATSIDQRRQDNPVHQVRVAEGNEAFIQTGDQVAYSGGDDGTVFKNVTTGFYVLPRVNGDRVILKVRPFKNNRSSEASGVIETQSADTTITGQLGEWLKIGGVSEQSSQSQSGIASTSSKKSRRKDRIWIRADKIR